MRRLFGLFTLGTMLIPGISGCGPSRTEVTGQVMYNGKTLEKPGGTISFLGPDGLTHSATIGADGNYRVEGVCVGENKVSIAYARPVPPGKRRGRVPDSNAPIPETPPTESGPLIPTMYAAPETSTLTVVVEKNTVYNPKLEGPEIK